jgi:hypothetical protein
MGSRGTIQIRLKNKTITLYVHWDSYPTGLGNDLVNDIKLLFTTHSLEELVLLLDNLKIVNYDMEPTDEDIKLLEHYTDLSVSKQSTKDWYCLLRKCQGSLVKTIQSGYALDHNDNTEDYNYVLDFNDNAFYIAEYDNVFELDNIPEDWIEQLECEGDSSGSEIEYHQNDLNDDDDSDDDNDDN